MWDVLMRTIVGFAGLLLLTRILGKKQLAQFSIFTYITGIAVGNMAGDMIIHKDVKIRDGLTGMAIWCFFTFLIEFISIKSAKARVILDGQPTIVIKKGQIIKKELKRLRLNIDDLTMLLRTKNIFSITDVDYAILEPNGDLSIIKKAGKDYVTKEDLNIPNSTSLFIPSEMIVDGKLINASLQEYNLDHEWLMKKLADQGIEKISDVLYAELQKDGSLYLQKNTSPNDTPSLL